ncbi:MAG: TatD family deoxyribonuclease [Calditrichaeota bacterium]|nr:TatD family deoxyribonuclease [Calditrichota bacterium]
MSSSCFDTHCHLTAEEFKPDLPEVIERARDAGVSDILVIALDADDALTAAEIAHRYELPFTAGIHPHSAADFSDDDLKVIGEMLSDPACLAVGEIGLDYKEGLDLRDAQQGLFRNMLELAREHQKPVVIHNRLAGVDIIKAIDEMGFREGGVMHCFSGDLALMEAAVLRGFYISFAGNLTYPKGYLGQVATGVPRERLLVETDAPYLTPVPKRGRRNEPAFVKFTAGYLGELIGLDAEASEQLTAGNARRLFYRK